MAEDRDISELIALPLKVIRIEGGYCVEDANKRVLAYHNARDGHYISSRALDWTETRLIAQAVARALTDQAEKVADI